MGKVVEQREVRDDEAGIIESQVKLEQAVKMITEGARMMGLDCVATASDRDGYVEGMMLVKSRVLRRKSPIKFEAFLRDGQAVDPETEVLQ